MSYQYFFNYMVDRKLLLETVATQLFVNQGTGAIDATGCKK
jgi:hypothetical protein